MRVVQLQQWRDRWHYKTELLHTDLKVLQVQLGIVETDTVVQTHSLKYVVSAELGELEPGLELKMSCRRVNSRNMPGNSDVVSG